MEKESKECVWCKQVLPITCFTKYSQTNPKNKAYYRPYCKACRQAYTTRPDKNKEKKKCKLCGKVLSKFMFKKSDSYANGLHKYCRNCDATNKLAERIAKIDALLRARQEKAPE